VVVILAIIVIVNLVRSDENIIAVETERVNATNGDPQG